MLYFGHGFGQDPIKKVFKYGNAESPDLYSFKRTDPSTRVRSMLDPTPELDCMDFSSMNGPYVRTSLSPCCYDEGLKSYEEKEH